jgi:hypothetical protein
MNNLIKTLLGAFLILPLLSYAETENAIAVNAFDRYEKANIEGAREVTFLSVVFISMPLGESMGDILQNLATIKLESKELSHNLTYYKESNTYSYGPLFNSDNHFEDLIVHKEDSSVEIIFYYNKFKPFINSKNGTGSLKITLIDNQNKIIKEFKTNIFKIIDDDNMPENAFMPINVIITDKNELELSTSGGDMVSGGVGFHWNDANGSGESFIKIYNPNVAFKMSIPMVPPIKYAGAFYSVEGYNDEKGKYIQLNSENKIVIRNIGDNFFKNEKRVDSNHYKHIK